MAVTPGTTNYVQVNPNQSNQDTDSQYAAEGIVSGGAQTDGLLPSKMFNKFVYQVSTFLTAFAQALTQKGYTVSDASLPQLQTVLANVLTQADQLPKLISLNFSPTLSFDASKATGWEVQLFGNVTSSTFVNFQVGQLYRFVLVQGGSGGYTMSWPSQFGSDATQPDPTSGAYSMYEFLVCTDNTIHAANVQIG